jgi:hypothetical protein
MSMAEEGLPRWAGAPGGRERVAWCVFLAEPVPPEEGCRPGLISDLISDL